MEYTVKQIAEIAGISARTLRHYDKIGLLKPARINSSGYRIYTSDEVDLLQQILFFRALDMPLIKIKKIIDDDTFDNLSALKEHKISLQKKQYQLKVLIDTLDKTIVSTEKGIIMNDKDKFEGFKEKLIDDNEKRYGKEVRAKYGDEVVNRSNSKVRGMSQDQMKHADVLAAEIIETLKAAFSTGDPSSDIAQKAVSLHKEWLECYWPTYSKEAHAGIAQMYVDDERFTAYYDADQPGIAKFLRDAVMIYVDGK